MESPERPVGPDEDPRVREEADAAAAEAAAIGGEVDAGEVDPAERPVAEAGGGEAEGFEQAEADLIERAAHGDPGREIDRGAPEPESLRSHAAYGDADEVEATEVVRDPEAGPDDPGAGPGIPTER